MAGQGGDDTYDVNDANDRVFESGGGGVDTVRASVGYTLPTGARVEFLRAAAANLTLGGNEQRDRIFGSSGADTLNGFAGADTLTGGLGPDVFRVSEASHSSPAGPDVVTDFSIAEGDLLDLSLIDANPASGADDAFTFIGSAAFTGVAGQLRAVVAGGVTTVSGDITGDGGRISRSRWRGAMR
jgi:Ca2+-binding RTX toxin-like protein